MERAVANQWQNLQRAHKEWQNHLQDISQFEGLEKLREVEKILSCFKDSPQEKSIVRDKLQMQIANLLLIEEPEMIQLMTVTRKQLCAACQSLKSRLADTHPLLVDHLQLYSSLVNLDYNLLKSYRENPEELFDDKLLSGLKIELKGGNRALDVSYRRLEVLMDFYFPATVGNHIFEDCPSSDDCQGQDKKTPTKSSRKSGVGQLHEVCRCSCCGVVVYCSNLQDHRCGDENCPYISETKFRGQVIKLSQEFQSKALAVVDPVVVHPAVLVQLGLQPFQLVESETGMLHPVVPLQPTAPLAVWMPEGSREDSCVTFHIPTGSCLPAQVVVIKSLPESAPIPAQVLDALRHRVVREGQVLQLEVNYKSFQLEVVRLHHQQDLPGSDSWSTFWRLMMRTSCQAGSPNLGLVLPATRIKVLQSSPASTTQLSQLVGLEGKLETIKPCLSTDTRHNALLYGKEGTGKKTFAIALASHLGWPLFDLQTVFTPGTTLKEVDHFFEQVSLEAPSVLLLSIPHLKGLVAKSSRRVSSHLLQLAQRKGQDRVLMLGIAEGPQESGFLKKCNFNITLEFKFPSLSSRIEFFSQRIPQHLLPSPDQLATAAKLTPGSGFGHLHNICRWYATNPRMSLEDHVCAMSSSQHGYKLASVPPKSDWSDIVGLESLKCYLQKHLIKPFQRGKITMPGILLYGPSSCGKTALAYTLAHQMGVLLFEVECSTLVDKNVGVTESKISSIFSSAQSCIPSMILLQNLDNLCPTRGSMSSCSEVYSRIVNSFLTELDGFVALTGVLVLATSSRPQVIDPAVLRKGRIGSKFCVPPPDAEARLHFLSTCPDLSPSVDLQNTWVPATAGWSVGQIKNLLVNARDCAQSSPITEEHLQKAALYH